MFGILIVILGVVLVAYMVFKRYYAPWTLLIVGLLLLFIVGLVNGTPIVTGKKATHALLFDCAQVFTNTAVGQMASLGIPIMTVFGFATYLDKIGATRVFVNCCLKPLHFVHAPYVLLAAGYIVGQVINIFIPSAVGLGVLMMMTLYPVLTTMGVSRVSAAALIVTVSCLDMGPASGNSILGSRLSGVSVMEWFVQGQLVVACFTMPAIAISHYFIQRYFDKKELASGELTEADFGRAEAVGDKAKEEVVEAPGIFAILPVLPIAFLFTFSKFCITTVRLEISTCLIVCIVIAFIFDLIRKKNFFEAVETTREVFKGMGKVFASTVALIICAGVFAEALKLSGGITTIINYAASFKDAGGLLMLIVMCLIMMIASIVTGSGNAAFFAFASFLPAAAKAVGWAPIVMACPVQLIAGIARSMSPIAGVTIAVSALAGLSPFRVVKRTIPVMFIGAVATVVGSLIML